MKIEEHSETPVHRKRANPPRRFFTWRHADRFRVAPSKAHQEDYYVTFPIRGHGLAALGLVLLALILIGAARQTLAQAVKPSTQALLTGNLAAEQIASKSKIVQDNFRYLRETAMRISDPALRKQILEILDNPAPTFYALWSTEAERDRAYEQLRGRGFVKASDPRFPRGSVIEGLFPPVVDPKKAPQRFWSAPGSSYEGHHSYPGGLVIHEAFNLRSALSLATNYRIQYPGIVINEDDLIAAPLWHDVMKAVVFQWREDESELPELNIAGTGAHHVLGLAEAMHRELPARLIIAIAAAHGLPGFEPSGKMADWLEAAAILAHVDPVEYGVLRKNAETGKLEVPAPLSTEAAIDNLSDADFVWTIPADRQAIEILAELAHSEFMMDNTDLQSKPFNHLRNLVFSLMTEERFYSIWLEGSREAVLKELRRLGLAPKT